jgi:peptidoglycan/xylan/chitin deacetylase (PgdA/CDA1 family)
MGDEEEELLRRTHDILSNLLGAAPVGWRSPSGRKTARTMRVLRQLGYLYDSSDKDYDLPYLVKIEGRRLTDMVELPNNTFSLDDFPWYKFSMTPASEVLDHWKQEFDSLYAEHGYFMLTFHPRSGWGSGGPSRAKNVEEMIRYIREHEGVHFVDLRQLAQWCLGNESEFE